MCAHMEIVTQDKGGVARREYMLCADPAGKHAIATSCIALCPELASVSDPYRPRGTTTTSTAS